MINIDQYVGPHASSPDWTPERHQNAIALLNACALLESRMRDDNVVFDINPATNSGVSGKTFGGFRPQDCPQGAPKSSHKEGRGVDRYDPHGAIDDWIMAHQDVLAECGLYIEHPDATPGWSHWTDKAPRSGNRVFYP